MKISYLSWDAAHKFVENEQNAKWNGWSIELFRPNRRAYYSPRGRFRNGQWGFMTVVVPNARGVWQVPNEFIRTIRA